VQICREEKWDGGYNALYKFFNLFGYCGVNFYVRLKKGDPVMAIYYDVQDKQTSLSIIEPC